MKKLIDFHCHLDLYPDHQAVIDACEKEAIRTLAVTTTPRAWLRNRELLSDRRYVRLALGLHPQLVGTNAAEELELWESFLPESRYVGEVGIDSRPNYYATLGEQVKVLTRILQCCAKAGEKILTVHSVRSAEIVLELIATHLPISRGRVVLHWFTGTKTEAQRALQLGCYFSINTEMIKTNRGKNFLAWLPLDRLLTETDGPFTKKENGVTHPRDVVQVIDALAELRNISTQQMRENIYSNLRDLVG